MTELRQDHVLLGGEYLGPPFFKVEIKGFGDPWKWDQRKGYGTSGASSVFAGEDLSKGSITVTAWDKPAIWTPTWEAFARKVLVKEPTAGTGKAAPKALAIVHPLVNGPPLNITSVNRVDVSQWDQDDNGLWTCEIKLEKFALPTAGLGTPNGTGPAGGKVPPTKPKVPAAKDAADMQIEALVKQFKEEVAK
jgi:hypothetical protein